MSDLDGLLARHEDLLEEVDCDAEFLRRRISRVPLPARVMFAPWVKELEECLEAFAKLKRAIPPASWARMKAFKAQGVSRGLDEERRRDRLEDRLSRLLTRDLPGMLKVG